jgi:hypothetical protein
LTNTLERVIGRSPDELSLDEVRELRGCWIALELYSPQTLPLRLIEAIGSSAADCVAQLRSKGLDPSSYEYSPLKASF